MDIYMDIDGLEQGCISAISNAQELLQSCTKPSIYEINFNSMHQYDTHSNYRAP